MDRHAIIAALFSRTAAPIIAPAIIAQLKMDAPATIKDFTRVNRSAVIVALIVADVYRGAWNLDDDLYDGLSSGFVKEAFGDWVRSQPEPLRATREIGGGKTILVPRYVPEVRDCDNIARSFSTFVDEACALDAVVKGIPRGNPAFGTLSYTRDGDGRHMRNWMIDRGGFVLIFDAGLGDFVTLSETERASITNGGSA